MAIHGVGVKIKKVGYRTKEFTQIFLFFIYKLSGQNFHQHIGMNSVVLKKNFLATHGLI